MLKTFYSEDNLKYSPFLTSWNQEEMTKEIAIARLGERQRNPPAPFHMPGQNAVPSVHCISILKKHAGVAYR